MKKNQGFTLIELLVVISMLGILSSVALVSVQSARRKAYYERSKLEARQIITALELWSSDNNDKYPCDVNREIPPGLEKYLSSNPDWPKAPFPGSVYDWDYWNNHEPDPVHCVAGSLSDISQGDVPVYQLSIRFCGFGCVGCVYPNESWAQSFDCYSSAYWCISGPCRAHGSYDFDHPACCLGGECPSYAVHCGF